MITEINDRETMSVSVIVLTGVVSKRIRKYATEEERQQAKLNSYKKYATKNITAKYVIK